MCFPTFALAMKAQAHSVGGQEAPLVSPLPPAVVPEVRLEASKHRLNQPGAGVEWSNARRSYRW